MECKEILEAGKSERVKMNFIPKKDLIKQNFCRYGKRKQFFILVNFSLVFCMCRVVYFMKYEACMEEKWRNQAKKNLPIFNNLHSLA